MKISIVTSYYNRKQQLLNTIKTIQKSIQINDLELIVVDDCSAEQHRLEDLLPIYSFLKLIRVNPEDRWYINPCVPFNMAIKRATGDIIIIQNPECLHVGDILTHAIKNVNLNNYIAYAVYSIDKKLGEDINTLPFESKHISHILKDRITPTNNTTKYISEGVCCWYNHSIYRPAGYHFISAIKKENMDKLNGFDERYAHGIGFDDDEILFRIKQMGLSVEFCDDPFGIHQWHYSENNFFAKVVNPAEASHKNDNIFQNITKKSDSYHVN